MYTKKLIAPHETQNKLYKQLISPPMTSRRFEKCKDDFPVAQYASQQYCLFHLKERSSCSIMRNYCCIYSSVHAHLRSNEHIGASDTLANARPQDIINIFYTISCSPLRYPHNNPAFSELERVSLRLEKKSTYFLTRFSATKYRSVQKRERNGEHK